MSRRNGTHAGVERRERCTIGRVEYYGAWSVKHRRGDQFDGERVRDGRWLAIRKNKREHGLGRKVQDTV